MKKIALMIAAAAVIFASVPASAQTVVVRDGMHRHHSGWHHRDRVRPHRMERHRHYERRGHRSRGPAIVIRP